VINQGQQEETALRLHRRIKSDGKPGKTGVGENRLVPGASSSINRLVSDQQIPSGTETLEVSSKVRMYGCNLILGLTHSGTLCKAGATMYGTNPGKL
jgi:hypothetical protein